MRITHTVNLVLSVALLGVSALAQPKAPLYNTAKQKLLEGKQVNAGRGTMALLSADDSADDVVAGAKARFGDDWAELKQTAVDIAQEIEAAARERPVLGIASAFVVGLVLGRLLSR